MPTEKPSVLPVAASAERSRPHPQPCITPEPGIKAQSGGNVVRLATLGLTSFATGLSQIPPLLGLSEPSSTGDLATPFYEVVHTALPLSLGAIFAAAFIDPFLRHSRTCPSYTLLLVPASFLTGAGHAMLLLLPMFPLPRDLSTALIAAAHLLVGVGNTVNFTTAMLLSRGSTPALGFISGMVAMGIVTQTCTGLLLGAGTRRLVAMFLALANGCFMLFASRAGGWMAAGGSEDEEAVDEKMLFRVKGGQGGFPPPPSRLTVLGALFAFAHQAAMVVIPVWLVSLTGRQLGGSAGQVSLVYAMFTFCAGLGVGSLTLIPPIEQRKQLVFSALLVSVGLLLLAWLLGDAFDAAAAAAPVGFFMASAYPWIVALLMHEMSEQERLSGVAIVVAFGTSGAVTALSITQMAAHLESPAVLHLAVMGLFGGMLMCWNAMSDAKTRYDLMELN
ncbi:hypothetical protein C8A03DRAFT_38606 [Achaetomium macrosporum]|uniref:MFS transporter n=1 Tax=Achaetomium macrosporum TaxID=79813 RepID=A0AAN7C1V4_9PEZI|nr:hypothetical protein C8A03DRAFT_38606 [Achaetomium macrosporum]